MPKIIVEPQPPTTTIQTLSQGSFGIDSVGHLLMRTVFGFVDLTDVGRSKSTMFKTGEEHLHGTQPWVTPVPSGTKITIITD